MHFTLSGQYTIYIVLYVHIQSDSILMDITARNDFLGVYDQKRSYKHVLLYYPYHCVDSIYLFVYLLCLTDISNK